MSQGLVACKWTLLQPDEAKHKFVQLHATETCGDLWMCAPALPRLDETLHGDLLRVVASASVAEFHRQQNGLSTFFSPDLDVQS